MEIQMESISIAHLLERDGAIAVTVSGYSMYPMLKDRRDCVVCRKYTGNVKKYDVLLYKSGKKLVLHRVISNNKKDGRLIIRGDNCVNKEYVPEENVLGILTEFTRKNKDFTVNAPSYRLYSSLIVALHPFVSLKIKTVALLSRLKSGILGN